MSFFQKLSCLIACLILLNCSSIKLPAKSPLVIKRIQFDFKPNKFQLSTEANGYVDVYSDKLEINLIEGVIKINPIYERFKTSLIYVLEMSITRLDLDNTKYNHPDSPFFNVLASSERIIIDKILESRKDFYDVSNIKFTILNITKRDLKNSRITLNIYQDKNFRSLSHAHTNEKNTVFNLFDF